MREYFYVGSLESVYLGKAFLKILEKIKLKRLPLKENIEAQVKESLKELERHFEIDRLHLVSMIKAVELIGEDIKQIKQLISEIKEPLLNSSLQRSQKDANNANSPISKINLKEKEHTSTWSSSSSPLGNEKALSSSVSKKVYKCEGPMFRINNSESDFMGITSPIASVPVKDNPHPLFHIPFLDSRNHDAVAFWIEELVNEGIIPCGLPLLNFDAHTDNWVWRQYLGKEGVTMGTWLSYLIKQELIGQVWWIPYLKPAYYHDRYYERRVLSLAKLDKLPNFKEGVIVTFDFDFFSDKDNPKPSKEEIYQKINKLTNFFKSRPNLIRVLNFTRSLRDGKHVTYSYSYVSQSNFIAKDLTKAFSVILCKSHLDNTVSSPLRSKPQELSVREIEKLIKDNKINSTEGYLVIRIPEVCYEGKFTFLSLRLKILFGWEKATKITLALRDYSVDGVKISISLVNKWYKEKEPTLNFNTKIKYIKDKKWLIVSSSSPTLLPNQEALGIIGQKAKQRYGKSKILIEIEGEDFDLEHPGEVHNHSFGSPISYYLDKNWNLRYSDIKNLKQGGTRCSAYPNFKLLISFLKKRVSLSMQDIQTGIQNLVFLLNQKAQLKVRQVRDSGFMQAKNWVSVLLKKSRHSLVRHPVRLSFDYSPPLKFRRYFILDLLNDGPFGTDEVLKEIFILRPHCKLFDIFPQTKRLVGKRLKNAINLAQKEGFIEKNLRSSLRQNDHRSLRSSKEKSSNLFVAGGGRFSAAAGYKLVSSPLIVGVLREIKPQEGKAGAELMGETAEVWREARIIKKVKEPLPQEYIYIKPYHILFTYLHLTAVITSRLEKTMIKGISSPLTKEELVKEIIDLKYSLLKLFLESRYGYIKDKKEEVLRYLQKEIIFQEELIMNTIVTFKIKIFDSKGYILEEVTIERKIPTPEELKENKEIYAASYVKSEEGIKKDSLSPSRISYALLIRRILWEMGFHKRRDISFDSYGIGPDACIKLFHKGPLQDLSSYLRHLISKKIGKERNIKEIDKGEILLETERALQLIAQWLKIHGHETDYGIGLLALAVGLSKRQKLDYQNALLKKSNKELQGIINNLKKKLKSLSSSSSLKKDQLQELDSGIVTKRIKDGLLKMNLNTSSPIESSWDERVVKSGLKTKDRIKYLMKLRSLLKLPKDSIGLYIGAGADASNFFLATDAQIGIFLDYLSFGKVKDLDDPDYSKYKEEYFYESRNRNFISAILLELISRMILPLNWELNAMGAKDIRFEKIREGINRVRFKWAFCKKELREREIIYFSKILIKKESILPKELENLLKEGIDFYFQKGGFSFEGGILDLPKGLKIKILKSIRSKGLIISDVDLLEDTSYKKFFSSLSAEELDRFDIYFGFESSPKRIYTYKKVTSSPVNKKGLEEVYIEELEDNIFVLEGVHRSLDLTSKIILKAVKIYLKRLSHPEQISLLDMGSGTGIVSILAKKMKVKRVVAIDIGEKEIINTKLNLKRFGFEDVLILQTDLFSGLKGRFDLIVFNFPAFPERIKISERFFGELKDFLTEKGEALIIWPRYSFIPKCEVFISEEDLKIITEKNSLKAEPYLTIEGKNCTLTEYTAFIVKRKEDIASSPTEIYGSLSRSFLSNKIFGSIILIQKIFIKLKEKKEIIILIHGFKGHWSEVGIKDIEESNLSNYNKIYRLNLIIG
ncbi:MAG: methyltransferase [Candidatus Omnitrophica bacterium]|nr:methyltransferase [Candidatus Omnitrophota bacterium]